MYMQARKSYLLHYSSIYCIYTKMLFITYYFFLKNVKTHSKINKIHFNKLRQSLVMILY